MSQCVPSWDIDDGQLLPPPASERLCSSSIVRPQSNSTNNNALGDVPLLDYEVAELTWENGQLAMHGLGAPRLPIKTIATWDKPRATGTLESLVNQATNNSSNNCLPLPLALSRRGHKHVEGEGGVVPWMSHHQHVSSASATMTMDALVPCSINTGNNHDKAMMVVGCSSTRVGSCSANPGQLGKRVPLTRDISCSRDQSLSGCSANNDNKMRQYKGDVGVEFTRSTTLENTSSDMPTPDDHDSLCHSSRPHQRKRGDEEDEEEEGRKKKKKGSDSKSSGSTKRTRAAAIHNQSERKRRDKINQRMKTLQKLVPNSSKTDKASMLDEVIEYLKQLQAQVHMMSRMNMAAPTAAMMLPLAMQQQQLQMSMMNPMPMGMGLAGMGMGMGMGMGRPTIPTPLSAQPVLHPTAFMPMTASWPADHHHPPSADHRLQPAAPPDPLSAFLACQSQPMSMEAYSRMAAVYQQLQQQQQQQPTSAPIPIPIPNTKT